MTYITLEGIDGSGKSTQHRILSERLQEEYGPGSVRVYSYSCKENMVGRLIKRLYAQGGNHPLSFLARRRLFQETIYALNARENLRRVGNVTGKVVLSDRSIITAYASHIDLIPEWFIQLVEPRLTPDLAILIDVPPEVGLERIAGRDVLLAEEDLESLRLFRDNYQRVFGNRPRAIRNTAVEVVDGNRPLEEVAADVLKIVKPLVINHLGRVGVLNGRAR